MTATVVNVSGIEITLTIDDSDLTNGKQRAQRALKCIDGANAHGLSGLRAVALDGCYVSCVLGPEQTLRRYRMPGAYLADGR